MSNSLYYCILHLYYCISFSFALSVFINFSCREIRILRKFNVLLEYSRINYNLNTLEFKEKLLKFEDKHW